MEIANGAARAISYFPRDPGNLTFKDSEAWVTAYADKDTTFTRNGAYRLDPRVLFHFGYICVSPSHGHDRCWKRLRLLHGNARFKRRCV